MEIVNVLKVIEIIISVVLVVAILLQQKEGGLGTTFGGGSGGGDGFRTKRGMELFLTRLTVVMIVLLVVNTLAIALI